MPTLFSARMHREEIRAAEVEAELVRSGAAVAVDPHSDAELDYWNACDLASAIEGAFHERIDPRALAPAEREQFLDRLGASYEPPVLTSDLHLTRFLWLIDRGERAG